MRRGSRRSSAAVTHAAEPQLTGYRRLFTLERSERENYGDSRHLLAHLSLTQPPEGPTRRSGPALRGPL
jgi:hypothetical protein